MTRSPRSPAAASRATGSTSGRRTGSKPRSTPRRAPSSTYVDEEYAGDVQALDGYGDWDYNSTYSSYVWRPDVDAGWQPYSYGTWYSTPVGLTWWSWDPWGWYPFHYGNWFFDAGWNSWCWSPGYVYSPAWVYWGYTDGYFGWCPTGGTGYSPWWNTYYRNIGWGRSSLAFAINGRFSTRQVDFRGWNFTGVNNLGSRGRLEVVPGTRVVDRLGSNIAISSRPIVLPARGGSVRDALREHVREAPSVIERTTSSQDTRRLAPVVGRQRTLPPETVEALIQRTVTADRGRIGGPGASEMAPRGSTAVVERGRTTLNQGSRRGEASSPRTLTGRPVDRSWDRSRGTQRNETLNRETLASPESGRSLTRPEGRIPGVAGPTAAAHRPDPPTFRGLCRDGRRTRAGAGAPVPWAPEAPRPDSVSPATSRAGDRDPTSLPRAVSSRARCPDGGRRITTATAAPAHVDAMVRPRPATSARTTLRPARIGPAQLRPVRPRVLPTGAGPARRLVPFDRALRACAPVGAGPASRAPALGACPVVAALVPQRSGLAELRRAPGPPLRTVRPEISPSLRRAFGRGSFFAFRTPAVKSPKREPDRN